MVRIKKEFKTMSLKDLIPYENNPRNNEEAVEYVIESIKQCENLDPIEIDENNVILSGHTRYVALKRLGISKTDVIRYDGLTEEQKKKYRILANKTNENIEIIAKLNTEDESKNIIVFIYSQKAENTSYVVRYIIDPSEYGSENDPWVIEEGKTVQNVPGDTASVIELAAAVNYDALYAAHPKLEGIEFFPDEVEKTLVLTADEEQNVLTFYYSSFKNAKVTVHFMDMDGNFGADYNSSNYMRYMNSEHGNQKNAGGLIQKQNGRTLSYTFNQLLTWNRSFGMHNFDVLLGHEWYDYTYEYLGAGKTSLVPGIKELRPGTTLYDADSYKQQYRINSFLSRLNYNYADRYYFSASFRQDASSRFYRDNNTGSFWSVGANWRISKEKFMQGIDWLDNLSFKISYGEQGNDNILDANGYANYYTWQSLYDLSYPNGDAPGGFVSTLENKEVSWEKNGNLNIGLEGTFFNSRLHASIEYFNKKTSDMLLNYPMALSTGFTGYSANVGDMRNQGWEFEISGTPVRTKDFEWTLGWMGSILNNKVLKLTAESPEIISGVRIIKEGYELNTFYMSKSAGVDPLTGQQLYWAYEKDDNGNKVAGSDYITNDYTKANASKYFLGSRIPDLYGSISTGLTYKGLALTMLTTYSLGGKIYDSSYAAHMDLWYASSTWNRAALRRWQKPGDITDVPRMALADGSALTTDRYLIDASYFAIKNITLSYTLPQLWVNKIGLGAVRVFTSMDNVALFTHLDGMDPQYNFGGGTAYDYVPNKTVTVGLEVKF